MSDPAPDRTPNLTPTELAFHLEEYKALRAEILAQEKASIDVFLYAVVGSGAISAWLITQRTGLNGYGFIAWKAATAIPLLVSVLAFYWSTIFNAIIATIARYHRVLEQRIGADGLGWEGFVGSAAEKVGGAAIPKRQRLRWLALLAGNLVFLVVA